MLSKHSAYAIAIVYLLFLAGCSSAGPGGLFPPTEGETILIDSLPPGADVYVMGEKAGVTPMHVNRKDVFPNIYPRNKETLYGKITLKKTGCADYTRTVSMEVGLGGLRAKLDCGDQDHAPTADAPRTGESVEQRLDRVKDLQRKGLITDEEARKARERILDAL